MKRNLAFIVVLIVVASTALVAYQQSTKLQRQGAAAIASIDLEIFAQRGAVYRPATAKAAGQVSFEAQLAALDQGFEKEPVKTLAAYQKLLQQDPGYLPLRLRMGLLALKLEQHELAREHLFFVYEQKEAALQPEAAWWLGMLYAKEGAGERAQKFMEESERG